MSVNISMPKGATLQQMNVIAADFENYLKQFKQIEQFQCRVNNGESAEIDILFKKEAGSFPYILKSELETKAVYTGLADFRISGVGQGFNNELNIETTNYGITLQGFNYDELWHLSENVKSLLLENPRVEKVVINSERDWSGEKSNYEYVFRVSNPEQLLDKHLTQRRIQTGLSEFSGQKIRIISVLNKSEYVPVLLSPLGSAASQWQVLNEPLRTDSGAYVRLNNFASIDKEKNGDQIIREDQQYQLVVNYNFIGDFFFASLVSERIIDQLKKELPVGYTVKEENSNFWRGAEKSLAWAVFFTIAIVFLICAVLLDSILQALTVVVIIPISFIGVFVTSWFFAYRFDEGGYAAFIILSGVVVNAALYFLNDYNNLLKDKKGLPGWKLYLKSYNSKIIPVLLSTASMILGLIPFIIYSKDEVFWYALAMSTIGGLVFSMLAILLFLPLFLKGMGSSLPLKETGGRKDVFELCKIFKFKRT